MILACRNQLTLTCYIFQQLGKDISNLYLLLINYYLIHPRHCKSLPFTGLTKGLSSSMDLKNSAFKR